MTHEQLIKLIEQSAPDFAPHGEFFCTLHDFKRFAALVAAAEREAIKAELEELRKANEEFGIRQEWWTERMVDLEAQLKEAVEAEREACAATVERGMGDWRLGKKVAEAIRARG